jgi:hypothetical protein
MNDIQLMVWAKMIASAMKDGNMELMNESYGKFSEIASMEDAAKLEGMIASLAG